LCFCRRHPRRETGGPLTEREWHYQWSRWQIIGPGSGIPLYMHANHVLCSPKKLQGRRSWWWMADGSSKALVSFFFFTPIITTDTSRSFLPLSTIHCYHIPYDYSIPCFSPNLFFCTFLKDFSNVFHVRSALFLIGTSAVHAWFMCLSSSTRVVFLGLCQGACSCVRVCTTRPIQGTRVNTRPL
jgi:hypothetical protein